MRISRRPFTLLELLVVLLLLSMGVALTGVNLRQAYIEQQFTAEVNQLLDQLKLAQELMLLTNADVYVRFSSDRKESRIILDTPAWDLKEARYRKIIEKPVRFQSIQKWSWNGETGSLQLMFSPGTTPKGELVLESDYAVKETVNFAGFPTPLKLGGSLVLEDQPRCPRCQPI